MQYLIIAILGEVMTTSALKAAQGFAKPRPSVIVVVGVVVINLFSKTVAH